MLLFRIPSPVLSGSLRRVRAVTADPCEYSNLAEQHPDVVQRLETRLKDYQVNQNQMRCGTQMDGAGAKLASLSLLTVASGRARSICVCVCVRARVNSTVSPVERSRERREKDLSVGGSQCQLPIARTSSLCTKRFLCFLCSVKLGLVAGLP